MTKPDESVSAIVIPVLENGKEGYVPADGLGLTKREYFAAMAMQALCTPTVEDGPTSNWDYEILSKSAVKAADALIAELNK